MSGVRSQHIWFCQAGRKPSSHCLSVRPQAWGHLALLKVTGQQLKRLANRARPWPPAPCSSPGIGLQRVQPVWKTTAAPLCLCVVEKIGLCAFRNLTKQRHRGGENPCCPQRASRRWAPCGLFRPWVVCRARLGRRALFVVGSRHATLSRGGPQTGVSPARLAWGAGWHLIQCLLGADPGHGTFVISYPLRMPGCLPANPESG